ncbi:hypothetical protein D7024_09570 [Desulfofundulus salinus]|uniref:Uncharacterized protein n=1 Tax=Desulfofundulus salinus TaxID=2419843 RepID=A0A494WW67_9FIRM|nr:hypothetical protein D7024_09570 [Desulfofundulus salinum]
MAPEEVTPGEVKKKDILREFAGSNPVIPTSIFYGGMNPGQARVLFLTLDKPVSLVGNPCYNLY